MHLYILLGCYCFVTAARRTFDCSLRCVFGAEATDVSQLFFFTYVSAAGNLDALLSCRPGIGGQEFKVQVGPSSYLYYLLDQDSRVETGQFIVV